jgi:hypothetical protein
LLWLVFDWHYKTHQDNSLRGFAVAQGQRNRSFGVTNWIILPLRSCSVGLSKCEEESISEGQEPKHDLLLFNDQGRTGRWDCGRSSDTMFLS